MKMVPISIAAFLLLATLSSAQSLQSTRYAVRDLGPLPGTGFSYAPVIADSGLITGWVSPLSGPRHAFLWANGAAVADIGAQVPGAQVGRLNSEAFGVNDGGDVAFQAETSDPDPNQEDFCGFTVLLGSSSSCPLCAGSDAPHVCRPFLWRRGVIAQLPMLLDKNGLKGNNGQVNHINNRGDVVGFAENATPDPDCVAPQGVFEFKPVVWNNGAVRQLAIPSGDRNGVANSINDNGQAVGASGTCTAFSADSQTDLNPVHALLWQSDGTPTDLGSLPGQSGNSASGINNRGAVIGSSGFYGFLWTQANGMRPLNPLQGDLLSFAFTINDNGSIVGGSLDASFTVLTAVRWSGGASAAVNLNTLVVDNPSRLYLQLAEGINSRGEIVGFGAPLTNSNDIPHGFLAIPVMAEGAEGFSSDARIVTRPVALSETARKLLQQRARFGRPGPRFLGPR